MSTKPDKTGEVDILHSNDMHISTRTITVFSDIDEKSASTLIKNLHILDSTSGTINILLMSGGGCVDSCMAMYDAIRLCRNHVKIKVYGNASSSASVILQAADERVLTPTAYIMVHIGTVSYEEDHPYVTKAWKEKTERDELWSRKVYLKKIKEKHPRFTGQKLEKMLMFDTILTAKEAVDLGLADSIEGYVGVERERKGNGSKAK